MKNKLEQGINYFIKMDDLGREYYPEYKVYEGPNWDFFGTFLGVNQAQDFVFTGPEGEQYILGQGRIYQTTVITGTTDEELEIFVDGLDRNEDGDPLEELLELVLDKLAEPENLTPGQKHLLQCLETDIRDYEGEE